MGVPRHGDEVADTPVSTQNIRKASRERRSSSVVTARFGGAPHASLGASETWPAISHYWSIRTPTRGCYLSPGTRDKPNKT